MSGCWLGKRHLSPEPMELSARNIAYARPEGAHVIVNYFEDRAGAEALAGSIGGTAIYADIGNPADVEKMIAVFHASTFW